MNTVGPYHNRQETYEYFRLVPQHFKLLIKWFAMRVICKFKISLVVKFVIICRRWHCWVLTKGILGTCSLIWQSTLIKRQWRVFQFSKSSCRLYNQSNHSKVEAILLSAMSKDTTSILTKRFSTLSL